MPSILTIRAHEIGCLIKNHAGVLIGICGLVMQALQVSETCKGMKQNLAWKPNVAMAGDVVSGELRILHSAAAWLKQQSSPVSVLAR